MIDLLVSDVGIRLAIAVGTVTSVVLLRSAYRDLRPRPHAADPPRVMHGRTPPKDYDG